MTRRRDDVDVSGLDLDALDALLSSDTDGLLDAPVKPRPVTTEDRLTRGFLEIVEFYRVHGREPSSTTMDISERKLGARLDGFRATPDRAEQVVEYDEFGLLTPKEIETFDELLASDDLNLLGVERPDIFDVSALPEVNVRSKPDDVAQRVKSKDFAEFEALFKNMHIAIAAGDYSLTPFKGLKTIKEGMFFIVGGVMAFVAEVGDAEVIDRGGRERRKERLRVIFENGTESSMYRQSFAIRLYENNGRAVTRTGFDASEIGDTDVESGHVYVLRSLSEDPQIAEVDNLYKIGFSRGPVEKRVANAVKEPTYLMAPVEVVADYRIYNARPSVLESLLHRVFAKARLDISQTGFDGRDYNPSEWFVAPLDTINQAVDMVITGDIIYVEFDPDQEKLVER